MIRTLTEKFEFSSEEESVRLPPQKYSINPKSPIASITSGNQQFTAIADTHHGKAAVIYRLAAEIHDIAKTGVKHLMLEYYSYPVGHPMRNRHDEQCEDILSRLNSRPPQITEKEIRDNYRLFASDHDRTTDKKTGKAHAELLINAMNAGIKVHYAGDDRGIYEGFLLDEMWNIKDAYLKKYAKLERFSQRLYDDPDYINKLNWPEKEKRALESRILTHREKIGQIYDDLEMAQKQFDDLRLGGFSEMERGERFVSLAKGEKSIVVFGSNHFNNGFDLNEAISTFLEAEAFKKGTKIQAKVPVVEIYEDRKHRLETIGWEKDSKAPIVDPTIRIYADTNDVEIPDSMKETVSLQTTSQQHKIHKPNAILEKQL